MGGLLFIGGWVALGLIVFFIAMSGGPRAARERLYGQSRRARRASAIAITAIFVLMGIAIPALVIASNEEDTEAGAARVELTPSQERGRELFGQICQQCHTLAAANAVGRTGTNLDELRAPKSLVLDAILKGRYRGQGTMPAGLYEGKDAEDVASFVAAVAGKQ